MKIARWYNNHDIRIEQVPRPVPGPGEILVKVQSCGICGSDVVEWYRLPRAPLVPGHEIGAVVAEVEASVADYRPGDRVFIAPKVPCGQCEYCQKGHFPVCSNVKERLPGGMAEYICVPQTLVEKGTYRLPDAISYDQSTFIEPLACVVRAQRLAEVGAGQTVLVMGCGMSGLLQIKLAAARGCRVIATDYDLQMIELARAVLADPPRWAEIIRRENIVLGVADATSLPFPDAHVDAVFAFGILHHIQNWPQAVREAHRVLKPGGVFSFEEFFLDAPPLRAKLALAKRFGIHPYVVIGEREFKRAFEEAGFRFDSYRRWAGLGVGCFAVVRKGQR